MDLAKHWRLRAARYRLAGQRHAESGQVRFPPEPEAGAEWQPHELSGRGSVYSFSVVRQPPAGQGRRQWLELSPGCGSSCSRSP